MDHRNALPTGYRLGEYRIEGLLGHGGFGLTYKAVDETLGKQVAIKEYLPNELAVREGDSTVHAKTSGDDDDFEWGLDRFLDEARVLARFNHPSIVSVLRFFQANNTAYMVMPMVEGETLSSLIKREGKLDETQVRSFLMPLLEGLQLVHNAEFLHRDIKPANIMINEYNQPVLLDFGSARQAMGGHSRSITSVITPGYAPIEQYDSKGDQGPWTDVYALAAVCYVALTGQRPADSPGRIRNDATVPVVDLAKGQASNHFLKAIDHGLLVEEENRPQTISDWQDLLEGRVEIIDETGDVPAEKIAKKVVPSHVIEKNTQLDGDFEVKSNNNSKRPSFLFLGKLCGLIGAIGLLLWMTSFIGKIFLISCVFASYSFLFIKNSVRQPCAKHIVKENIKETEQESILQKNRYSVGRLISKILILGCALLGGFYIYMFLFEMLMTGFYEWLTASNQNYTGLDDSPVPQDSAKLLFFAGALFVMGACLVLAPKELLKYDPNVKNYSLYRLFIFASALISFGVFLLFFENVTF